MARLRRGGRKGEKKKKKEKKGGEERKTPKPRGRKKEGKMLTAWGRRGGKKRITIPLTYLI